MSATSSAGPYFVGADIDTVMRTMSSFGDVLVPIAGNTAAIYGARFELFQQMQALARDAARRASPALT